MQIIITEWALNSYLELKGEQVFSSSEYQNLIRPDVLRLKKFPHDTKFKQGKFWSVAQDNRSGLIIPNGYKMKWHQIGNGLIQLRLTIGVFADQCFLCEAYVKGNEKQERRKLAKFKTYLKMIRLNRYTIRGKLT